MFRTIFTAVAALGLLVAGGSTSFAGHYHPGHFHNNGHYHAGRYHGRPYYPAPVIVAPRPIVVPQPYPYPVGYGYRAPYYGSSFGVSTPGFGLYINR